MMFSFLVPLSGLSERKRFRLIRNIYSVLYYNYSCANVNKKFCINKKPAEMNLSVDFYKTAEYGSLPALY